MTRYLVTAALPYANGPLHLGHIAGAYLPADIFVRYMKLKNEDIIFICGTDEHGVPITIKAEQENKKPEEIVNKYHNQMKESFKNIGIIFDNFSGTSREIHHRHAQYIFLKLLEKGYLEKKTEKQYFCEKCNRFLPDRYVEGICPHCNYEGARGDQCDNCGKIIDNISLLEPRCKICSSKPIIKETEHFYFKLNELSEKLQQWIKAKTHWKSNVKEFALGWIKEGLRPRAITRDLNWGVKVPIEGYEGKVLYVWFDAPIGYISSTMEWAKRNNNDSMWEDYWKNKDTKLIHFLGKDNIVFHSIIWPATLMALDENYILPYDIPANEYLNISGEKLSTSRNTAIWLDDFLKKYSADTIRYALSCNLPETKDSDFSFEELKNKNNYELADILGNFINRTLIFIQKYSNGELKKPEKLNEKDTLHLNKVYDIMEQIDNAIRNYKIRKATNLFMNIAREANKYFTIMEPWVLRKQSKERLNDVLYVCLKLVCILSYTSEPFIPFTSKKLKDYLNLPNIHWDSIESLDVPLKISKKPLDVLFPKIEDEKKEEKKEEYVDFNEFKKSKLIVAEILNAEKVEKADRLLKLHIDIGEEKRTIIAGVAEYYKPDELIGKKIVIVKNLKPAKIRGIESKGMLLAASNKKEKRLKILFVDDSMKCGDEVG